MQNSTATTALKKATEPTGKTLPLLAGIPDQAAAPVGRDVLLEEADLDDGVYVMFNAAGDRAAYDPKQNSHAGAEALLRVELGRRNRPVGVVVSIGGSLVLGQTPDGEPLHIEQLPDGKTRMTIDTTMVPLEQAAALIQRARAEKGEATRASK